MSIYAVNGKVPVAAWIPSRDSVGNGTSTLRDLVGSNNGTLTNMDPSTDWVSDTGAGGIRALDFDGTNDFVNLGNWTWFGSSPYAISFWFFTRNAATFQYLIGKDVSTNRDLGISLSGNAPNRIGFGNFSGDPAAIGSTTITSNAWHHVVISRQTMTANGLTMYVNGVLDVTSQDTKTYSMSSQIRIGAREFSGFETYMNGRMDDVRFFSNQSLNASDVAYLYNSGNGRGRIAAGLNRNHLFVGTAF